MRLNYGVVVMLNERVNNYITQIRVHKTLWPYQTVKIDGKRYCLTRLGFSLNVALLIMKDIVSAVLL